MVQQLASVGYSSALDLVTTVQNAVQAEGREVDENEVQGEVLISIRRLAEDDFFARIQPAQLQIRHDARQDADEHLVKHPPATEAKLKGKKAQEQHFGFVDEELEKRTDPFLAPLALQASLDAVSTDLSRAGVPGSDDLVIGINYARAVKAIRNNLIIQHATKTFGETFGKTASAVTQQLNLTIPAMTPTSPPDQHQLLSLSRIAQQMKMPLMDASKCQANGWHHDDEETTNGIVETNGDIGQDYIDQSLRSLAEGQFSFFKDGHDGTWGVDKMELRKSLVRQEIMKIARQRVGIIGVRLLRILIDKGRVDEKMLQEIALLNAKDMRQSLGLLHLWGFIELQEVPRDPQRQPNRTIFLWFYDEARVEKKLLDEIYKTMTRLYQRTQFEREKMRLTLEKVEQLGCEGREGDFMSAAEVTLLEQSRRKETWLLGEVMRLDDSVALLRDL